MTYRSLFSGFIGAMLFISPLFAQEENVEPKEMNVKTERANQVFFRGAFSKLSSSRGGEVFTDTLSGTNGDKAGYALSAGLDLALTNPAEVFNHMTLLGEVFLEYAVHSANRSLQTTSALLAGTNQSDITVSETNVTIAPKIRVDSFGSVRPYIIPGGMTWLVNSPPSNDSTYLDFGLPLAAGMDIVIHEQLSVGVDFRYTYSYGYSNTNNSYFTAGAFAGVNF